MEEEKKELSREEILEKSRKENLNGDERQRERMKYAPYVGWLAGLLAVVLFELTYIILKKDYFPFTIIMLVMLSAQNIYQAVIAKRRKKLFISCAIIIATCTVGVIICWILTLVLG